MIHFALLTPELRTRLSLGVSRRFMNWAAARPILDDAHIDAALDTNPNQKAVSRTVARLRTRPGAAHVQMNRFGASLAVLCVDHRVTLVDHARQVQKEGGRNSCKRYSCEALVLRATVLSWRKRCVPTKLTTRLYVMPHAVHRFIERGPFDPRRVGNEQILEAFAQTHLAVARTVMDVAKGLIDRRLDEQLAMSYPAPCPVSQGLWVIEPTKTNDDGAFSAVLRTYLGAHNLTSDQQAFSTACEDGDFVGALLDYPEALRRGSGGTSDGRYLQPPARQSGR